MARYLKWLVSRTGTLSGPQARSSPAPHAAPQPQHGRRARESPQLAIQRPTKCRWLRDDIIWISLTRRPGIRRRKPYIPRRCRVAVPLSFPLAANRGLQYAARSTPYYHQLNHLTPPQQHTRMELQRSCCCSAAPSRLRFVARRTASRSQYGSLTIIRENRQLYT